MSMQDEYNDALELVDCLKEVCPRSAPPQQVDLAMRQLLDQVGLHDTAADMRTKVCDLAQGTEYVRIFAQARWALKSHGVWKEEISRALADAKIDWRGQDADRVSLAANLERGWKGIAFQDMVLGCGIGDAFGAGMEFWDGQWIHANVDGSAFVCQRGDPILNFAYRGKDLKFDQAGAGQNYMPGMYTDDCEMTVGLMHALMAPDTYPPTKETMLQYWKDEYFKGQANYLLTRFWAMAGVGRNGHGGIANVYSGSCTVEDLCDLQRNKQFPGNAPPMRALPLAFVKDDSLLIKLSRANTDATHPHPKARAASLGIALAAQYYLIEQREPSGIIAGVMHRLEECSRPQRPDDPELLELEPETMAYLVAVDALPGPGPLDSSYEAFMADSTLSCLCGPQPVWQGTEVKPTDGSLRLVRGLGADAQRTLGCVLYMLKHHAAGMALQTLLRCVYVGGDVDSLAALCLAMVGGREGLRFGAPGGLPTYLLQQLEAAEYLVQAAAEFDGWVRKHHGD